MRFFLRLVLASVASCAAACAAGVTTDAPSDDGFPGGDDAASIDTAPDVARTDGSSRGEGGSSRGDAGPAPDAHPVADAAADAVAVTDSATGSDAASVSDAAPDTGTGADASDASTTGSPVTGGPCASGAPGATAIRIQFTDAGDGTASVQWLVEGEPDPSNDSAGAYGNQWGFTPFYVDQALAQGGVQLDDTDDIEITTSTAGISSITSATLSLYGRSYDPASAGSFSWRTYDGRNSTPADFVSNATPYQWYSADMTAEIGPGENDVRVRIKAGPSSDTLVVNEVELCLVAQ
jgi:hypothetical protein